MECNTYMYISKLTVMCIENVLTKSQPGTTRGVTINNKQVTLFVNKFEAKIVNIDIKVHSI